MRGKKNLKSLIRFDSTNKIDNYSRGRGKEKKKKSKRIYRTSQNIRIIKSFLESLLSESLRSLGVTVHLASLGCPALCCLWTCCGGCSDSNLVLLLCVLACNVHSYQN